MTFPKLEAALTEIKSLIKGITESSVLTTVNGKLAELESAISGELTAAKNTITEITGKLTEANTALEKAQGEANAFGAKVKALTEKIDGQVTALKLECKEGATEEEKFVAIVGAVNAAIEKTGVDLAKLPGTPAGKSGQQTKTITRADFEALPHGERSNFFKAGGKLKD